MTRRSIGRALAGGFVLVLTLGLVSPAAADERDDSAAWLQAQLQDGLIVGEWGPNYGASIDAYHSIEALGGDGDAIIDALAADPKAYVTGEEWGDAGSTYAGSTGKLAATVQLAGRSATSFGGDDLLARLRATIQADGADKGRASDISAWGDYSNSMGQSWVVRALALADDSLLADAATYLAAQQCANGSFRLELSAGDCTPHWDATALALVALLDARADGVTGLDGAITGAVDALEGAQAGDGSLTDDGVANSNTTALAAIALSAAGRDDSALLAADWVRARLVTPSVATGPLSGETGAIAFDQAAFDAGVSGGIDPAREQWTAATAQAAAALVLNPSAGSLTVDHPGEVAAGGSFTVVVEGLGARESVWIDVAGQPSAAANVGAADASGRLEVSVTAPTTEGQHTIDVLGQGTGRTGQAALVVTAADDSGNGDDGSDNDDADGDGGNVGSDADETSALPAAGAEVEQWMLYAGVILLLAGGAVLSLRRAES